MPLYSVAYSILGFLMIDYSLDCVFLLGFLPWFVMFFFSICPSRFVGDLVVLFFDCLRRFCYTVNGHRIFDPVLPNHDVLWAHADEVVRPEP